jgi:hypothetical protein
MKPDNVIFAHFKGGGIGLRPRPTAMRHYKKPEFT